MDYFKMAVEGNGSNNNNFRIETVKLQINKWKYQQILCSMHLHKIPILHGMRENKNKSNTTTTDVCFLSITLACNY